MQAFEFAVLDWIQTNMRCEVLDFLMPVITHLGDKGLIWIVLAVIMLFIRKTRFCGLTLGVGLGASGLLCNVFIKEAVDRARPIWINPDVEMFIRIPIDFSFPSGHTSASFTAATILFLYNKRFGIPAFILAALIGFSRLYLYVHFPSDVLAGMFLGILIGILSFVILKKISLRRASRS